VLEGKAGFVQGFSRPEMVSSADTGSSRRGMICSLVLHGLVLTLWLWMGPVTPTGVQEIVTMVPINLVPLVEETASPAQPQMAGLPQEKAADLPKKEAAVPPPPAKAPKTVALGKTATRHEAPAVQSDDFSSRLQALERQTHPPSAPQPGQGQGLSNLNVGDGRTGRMVGYGLKDAIRAQIERRWEFDVSRLQGGEMLVTLHLQLNGLGEILKAEIVDDPRYGERADYRPCAESARRAALASSPLIVPPGSLDEVRDVTLSLDPRRALR